MLASRRPSLNIPFDLHNIDSTISRSSSRPSFFDNIRHTTATPSPSEFDGRTTNNYFPPSPEYSTSGLPVPSSAIGDEYMSNTFNNFSNPAIRIQQSTPTPQLPYGYPAQSVLGDEQQGTSNWIYNEGNGNMMANTASYTPAFHARSRHQRMPSSSSAGSNSPASPYSQGHAPPLQNYVNHLPTPTQTPTQESFVASSQPPFTSSQFQNLEATMSAHMAMKSVFGDSNSATGEEAPGFSHSARQSVSSFGRNSPATPRTVNGDDFNEDFKVPSNDTIVRPTVQQVPKFERTMTDVYGDELYNPTSQPISSTPQRKGNQLLSPFHNSTMMERLQQANQARSLSPSVNSSSRGVSPFREGSRYAPVAGASRTQMGEQQSAQGQGDAMSQQSGQEGGEPKTISPKDALLEYHESEEDSKMPLFPEGDSTFHSYVQNNSAPKYSSFGSLGVGGAVNAVSGWPGQSSAAYSQSATSTAPAPPQQSAFNFAPASVPGMFHGLPNSSNSYTPTSMPAVPSEETPEFPAHLTSMESSASEAPPQSSNNSTNYAESSARPSSTLADTGTYTCTYHGCTQRFETPQKLQRHKREAHRQNGVPGVVAAVAAPSPTPGVGSGMTSAALLARNSQAGPHKCERINPTTGKPCNTIFSRPYDLTRHEDTIHNVRKQKVRCALCQEEKTFSRNDALTRHMRVVHPDVDFPGKHRRRGGRGDSD